MEKGSEFTDRARAMQPKLFFALNFPGFYTIEGLTTPGAPLFLTPLLRHCPVAQW